MAPLTKKRDDGESALPAKGGQGGTLTVAALFVGLLALISYPAVF